MAAYTGAYTESLGPLQPVALRAVNSLNDHVVMGDVLAVDAYTAVDQFGPAAGTVHAQACADDEIQYGSEWFEKVILSPTALELGNILSEQTIAGLVFPTYRKDRLSWDNALVAGNAGITIENGPSLPYDMQLFEDVSFDVVVATSGPASVDTVINFGFSGLFTGISTTAAMPVSLQRILLFPVPPELPFKEHLLFATDVLKTESGTEQRIALRDFPRQLFDWRFKMDEGSERSKIQSLLMDWTGRTFGVPVWHEGTNLTAAATAGDLTVTVASTANADFRVGGLAALYTDRDNYDVLTVSAVTSTTVTFTSQLAASYALDAVLYPVRTAVLDSMPSGAMYARNLDELELRFRVTDNVADLASTAGWSTYNGSVILDDANIIQRTMPLSMERSLAQFDGFTGKTYDEPLDRIAQRRTQKTFRATGKANLWAIRQLIWAIRGRQTSFYLPTFREEMRLSSDIANGTNVMLIESWGYADHIRSQGPMNVIRLTKTDGTTVIRTVTAATDNGTTESLTVDSNWDSDILAADVARVDILEKVRFDSDDIVIDHLPGGFVKRISAPTKGIIE